MTAHFTLRSTVRPIVAPLERNHVKLMLESIPAMRSANYNVHNLNDDLYIALKTGYADPNIPRYFLGTLL